MCHPDLHLFVERVRARELRERAERWRRARVPRTSRIGELEQWLGWALVRTGLRLVDRHA